MNIYEIYINREQNKTLPNCQDYNQRMIIRAKTPDKCRLLAVKNKGAEMSEFWANPMCSTIHKLGNCTDSKKAELIMQVDYGV